VSKTGDSTLFIETCKKRRHMEERPIDTDQEKIITTSCSYDCGSRCLLQVHVSDGIVTRIGTVGSSLKACVRGLMQRDVLYAPDRLRHPLKRIGERGEGKFVPIPWEEALETVSRELARVKEQYGPHSVLLIDSAGSVGSLHGTRRTARRFFSLFGGCTNVLTHDEKSPGGAFASNTCLVQIEKYLSGTPS
jgi:anaerobic dimethyl sulfoxide reductase subunit A